MKIVPDQASVELALERIVSSTGFASAPTLVRFLRFVVQETLQGRAEQLKEYTIAVEALGRPTSFEPSESSAVRVAARQLRFKLQEYYGAEGIDDAVVIDLPKGAYVPTFQLRELAASVTAPNAHKDDTRLAVPQRANRNFRWTFLLLIPLAVASYVATTSWKPGAVERVAVADTASGLVIAVLPFANLTGAENEEFISDGLSDEITSVLASIPSTRVIARTSAWKYKGQRVDIRDVGQQLGADYILEGSVLRSESRYRVAVQLNATRDGLSVWSEQYEVDRPSVFGLYDTIAQAVYEAISARMSVAPAALAVRRTTRDPDAQALYLEARFFWNQRTPEALHRAVSLFKEAIGRDSTFAQGWSGLAGVLATMEVNHITEPGVSAPQAFDAARRAIALDPTLGEPWASIGLLRGFSEWNWAASDSAFTRAVSLSPNYATARSWYSNTLLARGRIDDALEQLERARRIDPLSMPIAYGIAQANYYGRRWDAGLEAVDRALELSPGFHFGLLLRGKLLKGAGRTEEARAVFARLADSIELALLAEPVARRTEVERLLAKASDADKRKSQFWVATVYAQIGLPDSSFVWLERAYAAHQPDLVSLKTDPMIDPVKRDPRYADLMRRIGLENGSN